MFYWGVWLWTRIESSPRKMCVSQLWLERFHVLEFFQRNCLCRLTEKSTENKGKLWFIYHIAKLFFCIWPNLHSNCLLFTVEFKILYTNIPVEHAVSLMRKLVFEYKDIISNADFISDLFEYVQLFPKFPFLVINPLRNWKNFWKKAPKMTLNGLANTVQKILWKRDQNNRRVLDFRIQQMVQVLVLGSLT